MVFFYAVREGCGWGVCRFQTRSRSLKCVADTKRTSSLREEVRLVPLRLFTSGSVSERTTYLHHDRPLQTNLHKCLVFLVHLLNKILHILGKSFFLLAVHAGDIDWLAKFKDSVSLFKEWKVVF